MRASAWSALVFTLALLAGCPLFGGQDKAAGEPGKSSNPAFGAKLEGQGVTETAPLTYRVDLLTSMGPGQPLQLSVTLDGKAVKLAQPPVSSAPDIVRVDGPERLTALKPGKARISIDHQDNRAELAVTVKTDESAGSFQVINPSLRNVKGPVQAFTTDNYKYGNGGLLNRPKVWVTILGPGGKPVPRQQCPLFAATVTPDSVPSGWANDDREMGGIADFQDVLNGYNDGKEGMEGCGFSIEGSGFPIIGSGVQQFQLDIHWTCVGKFQLPECGSPGYPACAKTPSTGICGSALPGGTVKFGIQRQSPDECDYCQGR